MCHLLIQWEQHLFEYGAARNARGRHFTLSVLVLFPFGTWVGFILCCYPSLVGCLQTI